MTPDELRAEARRLGDNLAGWLKAYDRRGQTFRQFADDYAVAARELTALLQREGVPQDVIEDASYVWEIPIQRGYEPEAYAPPLGPDDIIGGDDPRVARFWTRQELNAYIEQLWKKCDEIRRLDEHTKADAFAAGADQIRTRLAPRHEPYFWVVVERMLSDMQICGYTDEYRSTEEPEIAPWENPPPSPRALRMLESAEPAADEVFQEALDQWESGAALAVEQGLPFDEFWRQVDALQAAVDALGVTVDRYYAYWAAGQTVSTAANRAGYKPYSDWVPGGYDF